jgi:hypothetical protein
MQEDLQRYIPVQHDGASGTPQTNAYFMMRALLTSRVDIGLPSDADGEEHDVNIYLTHLLCDYVEPKRYARIAPYLAPYDTSVFERVQHSRSPRVRYTVYKANADHLLITIGVFQNPGARPRPLPAPLQEPPQQAVGRGKAYYEYATTYGGDVFGRTSAVAGVMGKLASRFETYVRLLGHVRSEYFNLVTRLGEGEIYHLEHESNERALILRRDAFLDALAAYRKAPARDTRAHLVAAIERLRQLDPGFEFGCED